MLYILYSSWCSRAGKVELEEKTPLSPLNRKEKEFHSLGSPGFVAPAALKARLIRRDKCQDSLSSRAGIGIAVFEVPRRNVCQTSPLYCSGVTIDAENGALFNDSRAFIPTYYYLMFLKFCQ
jgi:hypothetical protein